MEIDADGLTNMNISVCLNAAVMDEHADLSQTCAVIIDVLRATTVMTIAGSNGARSIATCSDIESAKKLAGSMTPRPLLCGERQCKKIAGFDLGNSPREYTRERVDGKRLILTTTNGTRAIEAARTARRMIVASFANLFAVVETLQNESGLSLVCAGTNGEVTYEDVLLAGAIADGCLEKTPDSPHDDSTRIALAAWREGRKDGSLLSALAKSQGGRNLVNVGYANDLDACAELNSVRGYAERLGDSTFEFKRLD